MRLKHYLCLALCAVFSQVFAQSTSSPLGNNGGGSTSFVTPAASGISSNDAHSALVNVTGDTMSGNLTNNATIVASNLNVLGTLTATARSIDIMNWTWVTSGEAAVSSSATKGTDVTGHIQAINLPESGNGEIQRLTFPFYGYTNFTVISYWSVPSVNKTDGLVYDCYYQIYSLTNATVAEVSTTVVPALTNNTSDSMIVTTNTFNIPAGTKAIDFRIGRVPGSGADSSTNGLSWFASQIKPNS